MVFDDALPLRLVSAVSAAAVVVLLLLAPSARAQSPSCVISAGPDATAAAQAPPLRFGIYPGGPAGSVDPKAPPRPEDPAQRLAALQLLRGTSPFVVRLYTGWTGDASADDVSGWLDDEIAGYTANGLQVELVVRYKPATAGDGSPADFARYVRGLVRHYGHDAGFTSLQVTNEANLDNAPDASDGAFAGATEALVQGVIAAKAEARTMGNQRLGIGFSWAHDERSSAGPGFWEQLGRIGGDRFARSVDWVGLDSYPGTWSPQLPLSGLLPGLAGTAVTDALRSLRDCYLPLAGLGRSTVLHVAENGFPTGAGRGDDVQSQVLDSMVRAVDDVRGDYGVSDYRWFDLRDSSSADASFESHYGITRDDYSPKPGFWAYRDLIDELGGTGTRTRATAATAHGTSCRPSPVRISVAQRPGERMSALTIRVGGRLLRSVKNRPIGRTVALSLPSGRATVALRVRVRAGARSRIRSIRRTLRVC